MLYSMSSIYILFIFLIFFSNTIYLNKASGLYNNYRNKFSLKKSFNDMIKNEKHNLKLVLETVFIFQEGELNKIL